MAEKERKELEESVESTVEEMKRKIEEISKATDEIEDKDLKQKEVAAILEMSPEVYRRYEKGLREIPVWALIKLADYYQTSTDYLLGRTDDPSAPRA